MIDLRSDTVTRPSKEMRAAMANAEVGDDVFGEDPSVNSLEERVAEMFGHEAGLFCPSGTMTNQIAINIHTRPGDEIICDEGTHIYRYEGGGTMATSGCSVKFVPSDRGRFTAESVAAAINDPDAQWLAHTRLVELENTCNRGGGAIWDSAEVDKIRTVCDTHGLALHNDGARIFNALAVTKESPSSWGKRFDTISICLSKGLGAPAGSILVGSKPLVAQARRVRKRLGGGMRQTGILAAAGHYVLDNNVARLVNDHAHAKQIGEALRSAPYVAEVMSVETNIIIFTLAGTRTAVPFLAKLKEAGILAAAFGPNMIRMVLHLDVSVTDVEKVTAQLEQLGGI